MDNALASAIHETQDKYRLKPEAANAVFSTRSELTAGLRSDVTIRQHQLVVDEPPALGGADQGPNPIELVLGALGACQEITYKAYAAAMGIPLERVSVELEGDIDLRGFFGVDDSARPGFHTIRGRVTLESSAPSADLDRLKAAVDSHCPVLDMLSRPVDITLERQD